MLRGNSRAALLIESIDGNGKPVVMVYHLAQPIQMRMEREFDSMFDILDGSSRMRPTPTRVSFDGYLADPNPRQWNGPMPNAEQEEIEPAQLALETNEDVIIEGELIEEDVDYEWAFWDSDPEGLHGIWQSAYGIPFDGYESAKRIGDKNVFGQTVVGRRKRGSNDEWKVVKHV